MERLLELGIDKEMALSIVREIIAHSCSDNTQICCGCGREMDYGSITYVCGQCDHAYCSNCTESMYYSDGDHTPMKCYRTPDGECGVCAQDACGYVRMECTCVDCGSTFHPPIAYRSVCPRCVG